MTDEAGQNRMRYEWLRKINIRYPFVMQRNATDEWNESERQEKDRERLYTTIFFAEYQNLKCESHLKISAE